MAQNAAGEGQTRMVVRGNAMPLFLEVVEKCRSHALQTKASLSSQHETGVWKEFLKYIGREGEGKPLRGRSACSWKVMCVCWGGR